MSSLITLVVSILVFGVIILVHELGHFLAARRFGIQVVEFSIGFGPALWSKVKNGTRYSLRLIPIGGYNLMDDGETEEEEENPPAPVPSGIRPLVVCGKAFPEATAWQRFFVIAAGAAMNFLLGFLLLVVLLSYRQVLTSKIIYDFSDNARSQATGLQSGDEILAINGHHCFVAEDVYYELQRTTDFTADFTVLRNGQRVVVQDVQFDSTTDEDGNVSMVLDFRVYGISVTPRSVFKTAVNYFIYYARIILRGFQDLFVGQVGLQDLSGPVGVVTAVGQAVGDGWRTVLELSALLTINLGIFNLLPIPGLDGGKLLFLAWEGITRHPVPERIQLVVNTAGILLLLGLMILVTWQDVFRIF